MLTSPLTTLSLKEKILKIAISEPPGFGPGVFPCAAPVAVPLPCHSERSEESAPHVERTDSSARIGPQNDKANHTSPGEWNGCKSPPHPPKAPLWKESGGIAAVSGATALRAAAIPPSRLTPRHLPLHKGGVGRCKTGGGIQNRQPASTLSF